jgi:formiminotetrahydrofolate cyclodeaminase
MLDQTIATFLDDLAARSAAPGGGAVSALTVAMSAGLIGMAARFSDEYLESAHDLADKADVIRAQVGPLAQADADAYRGLLAALRLPRDEPNREETIAAASQEAADVPLEISAYAAEVALIAAQISREGNPNLQGDAIAAALIAAAAARACANLVRINLDASAEEFGKASEHARVADAAAGRAFAAQL